MNPFFTSILAGLLFVTPTGAAERNTDSVEVTFSTSDQGTVYALLAGEGTQGVVLAHGAIFNKESWDNLTKVLVAKGLRTLALDFRGYGKSKPGLKSEALYEDILAAVRYLHQIGVRQVSVIGASMGGGAAGEAAIRSQPGEINKLILLSPVPITDPDKLQGELLFIASKAESLANSVKGQYEKAPNPKKLILIESDAHAQHIFRTDQAEKLNQAMIDFLVD